MRPRRSRPPLSRPYTVVALAAVLSTAPFAVRAQQGVEHTGASELIFPTGARTIAMGQAMIAEPSGTESVWWNPALLAWTSKRELAMHFTKTLTAEDNAAGFLLPVGQIGTVTLSGRLFNYGDQDVNPLGDTLSMGTFSTRAYIWAVSFAAPIGDRLSAGVTYKIFQFQIACTAGDCSQAPLNSASTSAVDVGMHWRLPKLPVSLGAVIQNVGPGFQFNDSPQRDPLPARLSVGASYAPIFASLGPDAEVHFDAGVVARLAGGGTPGFRLGSEVTWQKKVAARAGYVLYGPTGSGPSAGLGLNTGRLQIDLARFFSDLASQSGQTPTFVSLRFQF